MGETRDKATVEMAGAEDVSALPTGPHPEHLECPLARLPAASAGVSLPEGLLLSLLCYNLAPTQQARSNDGLELVYKHPEFLPLAFSLPPWVGYL